jgi:polyphosphate glucokinase
MNVLVVDIGGTNVKILATGQAAPRKFPSGPTLTPKGMVAGVKKLAGDWKYDVVSIGYPGPILGGRPISEPFNLGPGWVGFNFEATFGRPVKVINDAAMQALGSYQRGKMLFLGLGTGLGSTMIVDGIVEPAELGGLKRMGRKKWERYVVELIERLIAALEPDDVVLGGGNVKQLKKLPAGCRAGDNANAFLGGFRLWERAGDRKPSPPAKTRS